MTEADGRPSPAGGSGDDAAVTQQLRRLSRDRAMPRDVSLRIAAAIEAEAQAARERGTLDVPAEPADQRAAPEPRGWFRRRMPVLLAGAAGLGMVTFGLYLAGSGGGADDAATAGAGSSEAENGRPDAAPEIAEDGAGPDTLSEDVDEPTEANADAYSEANPLIVGLVSDIASSKAEVEPGCGDLFADAIGAELVGSAVVPDGVLVVTATEGTSTVDGWTLGSCTAREALPGFDPVIVPRQTP